MHDECMMALVFGFTEPLLDKILSYSLPSEYEFVMDLFSDDIEITFNNGNLVISNWRNTKNPYRPIGGENNVELQLQKLGTFER